MSANLAWLFLFSSLEFEIPKSKMLDIKTKLQIVWFPLCYFESEHAWIFSPSSSFLFNIQRSNTVTPRYWSFDRLFFRFNGRYFMLMPRLNILTVPLCVYLISPMCYHDSTIVILHYYFELKWNLRLECHYEKGHSIPSSNRNNRTQSEIRRKKQTKKKKNFKFPHSLTFVFYLFSGFEFNHCSSMSLDF